MSNADSFLVSRVDTLRVILKQTQVVVEMHVCSICRTFPEEAAVGALVLYFVAVPASLVSPASFSLP